MSQQNVLCYSLKEIYPADSAIHPSIKRSQSCPDIFEYPAQIENNGQRLKLIQIKRDTSLLCPIKEAGTSGASCGENATHRLF